MPTHDHADTSTNCRTIWGLLRVEHPGQAVTQACSDVTVTVIVTAVTPTIVRLDKRITHSYLTRSHNPVQTNRQLLRNQIDPRMYIDAFGSRLSAFFTRIMAGAREMGNRQNPGDFAPMRSRLIPPRRS